MQRLRSEGAVPGPRGEHASAATEAATPSAERAAADQLAEARGNMYRLLSALYLAPPGPELLHQLADAQNLDELSSLFGERAVFELKEYAAVATVDRDAATLKQEYMDLFGVPTGRYVSPFEDVHWGTEAEGERGKLGPLLGERAIEVIRKYREAGAEIDRACKELPTHVGVELAFMSFLCEREAGAHPDAPRGTGRDPAGSGALKRASLRHLQRRFLDEHLNRWFPRLSGMIQAKSKSSFYRGLAVFAEQYLAQDSAFLAGASGE